MTLHKTEENKIPKPEHLLSRVNGTTGFDSYKILSLLPLAKEFEARKHSKPGKLIAFSAVAMALFLLCAGSVYALRYYYNGFVGATADDLITHLLFPALLMLLAGISGFIIHLIYKLQCMNVFKTLYSTLVKYLSDIKTACKEITGYINKYLTVYYNYHIRYSRIEKLEEEIILLELENEKLKQKSLPVNIIADIVCAITGKYFDLPVTDSDEDEKRLPVTKAGIIAESICSCNATECTSSISSAVSSVWIQKAIFGIGNINGGNDGEGE